MHLSELQAAVTRFRDDRDWGQFHQPKDLALAIGAESGELSELFLWKQPEEIHQLLSDPNFRGRLADEMADVFAFLLSLAAATKVDLGEALLVKLQKNAVRYPVEKAKGNAKKYNER